MKKRQVVEDAGGRPPSGAGDERPPSGWMAGQCVVLQRLFSCRHLTLSGPQAARGVEAVCDIAGLGGGQLTLREARDRVERYMVRDAISACGGNMSKAAEVLGVSRPALYDLVKKYGLCRIKARG